MSRSPRRKYSPEDKARFFAVFDKSGSTTAAARELGLNRHTCAQWVYGAGLSSTSIAGQRRAPYLQLRAEGSTQRMAAAVVGVHIRTARDWDQGILRKGQGRLYPDGRFVDYKRGVTTTVAPPGALSLAQIDKVLDPRFLSVQEREYIADEFRAGSSLRRIASGLGRSASSISRELARNSGPGRNYMPHHAQRSAASRRPRPKSRKLLAPGPLREFVAESLRKRYSPEQIRNLVITTFPDDQEMRVSTETIYQALYFQARGGLKREVQDALRKGRVRRIPRTDPARRRPRFVDKTVMISERPAEIEDRAVPGHWEGDLIMGSRNQSAIGTLVERSTRYTMLVHLPRGDHTAETMASALASTMKTLPGELTKSLTWDQGTEMAGHRTFTIATDIPVFFCDPASPWQRGSNENTNGLLRQYFPKGTDLSVHSPEHLAFVAAELNGRPRKTLGWDNPAQRLRDLLEAI